MGGSACLNANAERGGHEAPHLAPRPARPRHPSAGAAQRDERVLRTRIVTGTLPSAGSGATISGPGSRSAARRSAPCRATSRSGRSSRRAAPARCASGSPRCASLCPRRARSRSSGSSCARDNTGGCRSWCAASPRYRRAWLRRYHEAIQRCGCCAASLSPRPPRPQAGGEVRPTQGDVCSAISASAPARR